MFIVSVNSLIVFLCVALGVAFYTLLERKVLSYIQLRKGPNKVGILGLPQPLADAAKLFTKENVQVSLTNKPLYIVSPVMSLVVAFTLWSLYISSFGFSPFSLGALFFLCVSSLNVYSLLISGWSSNSNYALLGAIRAVAQTISYEVSIALVLASVLMVSFSFDLEMITTAQHLFWFFPILILAVSIWFISSLAETNRAPFDLSEGESELVSGFNIEYGSGEFAFLFIAEYGSILLMSMITVVLFFGAFMTGLAIDSVCKLLLAAFMFLWVRGSFPRIRYDVLILLTWKTFLTVTLVTLMLVMPFVVL